MVHSISLFLLGRQALKYIQFYKSDRVTTEMDRFLVGNDFILVIGEQSNTSIMPLLM